MMSWRLVIFLLTTFTAEAHRDRSTAFPGSPSWSPLATLPPLKKVHHSYAPQPGNLWDPTNTLHDDFVRITHTCGIYGFDVHTNATRAAQCIDGCVAIAARHPGAGVSIFYSPWFYVFPPRPAAPSCCPNKTKEAVAVWEANLAAIKALLLRSNARHGANVSVSAVLLDSERFTVARGNATWNDAMTAKHDMMYNASKRAFPSAPVEFYDRGGYTMDGVGTAYFAPSPYYTLEERGDSFATSLYGVGELGYTREQYDQTVALALAHNASAVTPWISLGAGNVPTWFTQTYDFAWDYPILNSWLIGRDVNNAGFPGRLGHFGYAKVGVFFPSPLSTMCNEHGAAPIANSTLYLQHFVAYVLGSACVHALPNETTATAGWTWDVTPGPWTGGCYI